MKLATVVLPGHPNKACDIVSEAIIDEYQKRDPETRIRIHVQGGHGVLFVTGTVHSQADFDVSAIAKRALASAGVLSDIEPFISIEPMPSEHVLYAKLGHEISVSVMGYATNENVDKIPQALFYARNVAQLLEKNRTENENWFWLGADCDVSVLYQNKNPIVYIRAEHGIKNILEAREAIILCVHEYMQDADVRVNVNGAQPARGLLQTTGASGMNVAEYGFGLPALASPIGYDIYHAQKSGAWLARIVAKDILQLSGSKAVMMHAVYPPGEKKPLCISVRDEQGKNLSSLITKEMMSLERVKEFLHPAVNVDMARWGFVK